MLNVKYGVSELNIQHFYVNQHVTLQYAGRLECCKRFSTSLNPEDFSVVSEILFVLLQGQAKNELHLYR